MITMGLPIQIFGTKKGRKWSAKYKKSINCRRPKGFSQKQHCRYGRNGKRMTRKTIKLR
jgi:hypothetical protein